MDTNRYGKTLRKRQENSQREIKGRAGDEIRHTGVIVSE